LHARRELVRPCDQKSRKIDEGLINSPGIEAASFYRRKTHGAVVGMKKLSFKKKKLKIAFAGPEICGHYSNLQKGFKSLGIDVDLCTLPSSTYDFSGDYSTAWPVVMYRKLGIKRASVTRKQWHKKIVYALSHEFFSSVIMPIWSIFSYDVLFFGFGMSYSRWPHELYLYRLFNRKIIFTFLGSDARAAYLRGDHYPAGVEVPWDKLPSIVKKTKHRITTIERYANYIIAAPSISHLFSRKCLDFLILGSPVVINYDITPRACSLNTNTNRPIKILHAPSSLAAKGSVQIQSMIDRLKNKGYSIDYMLVHGVTNAEVHEAIKQCDFVIDCLWADCPAGVLAAEAGVLGKPVIIGGYFEDYGSSYYSKEDIPPYLCVPSDAMEQAIETLIVDAKYRAELGESLQVYMKTYRTAEQIASKYLKIIEGDIPEQWWFDPCHIVYVNGSGAPEYHIKALIRGYIQRYGISGLKLSDKPKLEEAFINFSGAYGNEQH